MCRLAQVFVPLFASFDTTLVILPHRLVLPVANMIVLTVEAIKRDDSSALSINKQISIMSLPKTLTSHSVAESPTKLKWYLEEFPTSDPFDADRASRVSRALPLGKRSGDAFGG